MPDALGPVPHVASVPAAERSCLSICSFPKRPPHPSGPIPLHLSMPKKPGTETQPKKPHQGRRRPNTRPNRRWPVFDPAPPSNETNHTYNWGEPAPVDTWGEVGPSGWGDTAGWGLAKDDWALEAYTGPKIEAWIRQVEACRTNDPAPTPLATNDDTASSPVSPLDTAPTPFTGRTIKSKLYRWALNFLNRENVSADRKRQALGFLNQSREQQVECIRRLIEEIRVL